MQKKKQKTHETIRSPIDLEKEAKEFIVNKKRKKWQEYSII